MSLLTICQNVADDCGVNVPAGPIYGSTAPAARRLLRAAERAGQDLLRCCDWTFLITEYVWTATGVSDYPMPPDYARMVGDSLWERTRYWALRGAMSPQQWQVYRSSIYGRATVERRWRIRVPSGSTAGTPTVFSLDPQLGSGDTTSTFVMEYVSNNWCRSAGGQMQPGWRADSDTCLFDEQLVELGTRWRVLRRLGLEYDEEKSEYDRQLGQAMARDGGSAVLGLVPSSRTVFVGPYNIPDTGFGPVPP